MQQPSLPVRASANSTAPGRYARALADGRIVRAFAFRGATHLMTPQEGGVSCLAAASDIEAQLAEHSGLTPSDSAVPPRGAVREALAEGRLPATSRAARHGHPKFRHLGFAFADRSWTLLKPLAWQGEIDFGPRETDVRPSSVWRQPALGRRA